jgi:hypothetical protein
MVCVDSTAHACWDKTSHARWVMLLRGEEEIEKWEEGKGKAEGGHGHFDV